MAYAWAYIRTWYGSCAPGCMPPQAAPAQGFRLLNVGLSRQRKWLEAQARVDTACTCPGSATFNIQHAADAAYHDPCMLLCNAEGAGIYAPRPGQAQGPVSAHNPSDLFHNSRAIGIGLRLIFPASWPVRAVPARIMSMREGATAGPLEAGEASACRTEVVQPGDVQ